MLVKGFTDRHTWVKNFYYEDSPLIFDHNYKRKESYYGLRDAIQTMVVGGTVGGGICLNGDVDSDGRPWGSTWMQGKPSKPTDFDQITLAGDSRPDWLQS